MNLADHNDHIEADFASSHSEGMEPRLFNKEAQKKHLSELYDRYNNFFEQLVNKGVTKTNEITAWNINFYCYEIHAANVEAGWWTDLQTGESLVGKRNVGEMLALVHSEVSEALEGHRDGKPDKHLPHRSNFEVELADAVIRIFDLAAGLGVDLGGAMVEKLAYNKTRADHKVENRVKKDGKRF